ncbi:MAG: type I-U CRISPR-associated protein Cas5/Cas6, partial [Candidatus Schekmanbacteria bacterium RBG_13_48_7]
PLYLCLQGIGYPDDFNSFVFGKSKKWKSVTPFIMARHPKLRGETMGGVVPKKVIDSPVDQLKTELLKRGYPQIETITNEPELVLHGRKIRWLQFRRWRMKGKPPVNSIPFGFRINFCTDVQGPILAGYASHFGLGMFTPFDEAP